MRFTLPIIMMFFYLNPVFAQGDWGARHAESSDPNAPTPYVSPKYLFCNKPYEPSCLQYVDEKSDFKECLRQVQAYLDKAAEYQACLTKEVAEKNKKMISDFICKIKGEDFCN